MIGGIVAGLALPVRAADFAYSIRPEAIGDGIWMVRGADAAIQRENGGAIANLAILATNRGTLLIDCGPSLRYGRALKAVAEKLTGKPVTHILFTHLHPDHGFAAGAFPKAQLSTTAPGAAEIEANARGYSDGMYRLLGDWMRGTEVVVPRGDAVAGETVIDGRRLTLLALSGHSPSDLAVVDAASGILVAGDLVFHDRAPSTPDADFPQWRRALGQLRETPHGGLLPGHGPFDPGGTASIDQTRDWIDWLDEALRDAVRRGLDMVEAGELPIPPRFARLSAARYELQRSVSHFYPRLEEALLTRIDRPE